MVSVGFITAVWHEVVSDLRILIGASSYVRAGGPGPITQSVFRSRKALMLKASTAYASGVVVNTYGHDEEVLNGLFTPA
jgi:hypothetical protein